ncbi:hypothetical protein H4R35_001208 [Dimargaris xerosporica]|nr:hypothetical protein H4R35_001208 [Dimargaris xerosporica]
MGLSERKAKVAIGADPNNLAWRSDTNGFGYRMLAKMGWKSGKGLGVNEDGTTKHVAIKRKGDNMGIGASVNTTDNWLNNAMGFTALLERLNSAPAVGTEMPSNTVANSEPTAKNDKKTKKKAKKSKADKRSKRKRAHTSSSDNDGSLRTTSDASDGEGVPKSKRHKDKKRRKKDSKHSSGSSSASEMATPEASATLLPLPETKPLLVGRTARVGPRAKFIRSKRLATRDPTSLNEILGIKPSASQTSTTIEASQHSASGLSVQDYFAAKMDPALSKLLSQSAKAASAQEPLPAFEMSL